MTASRNRPSQMPLTSSLAVLKVHVANYLRDTLPNRASQMPPTSFLAALKVHGGLSDRASQMPLMIF